MAAPVRVAPLLEFFAKDAGLRAVTFTFVMSVPPASGRLRGGQE